MADVKLAEATDSEVPRPFRWTPADAATREALNVAGTNADDVGCIAWQQDDNSAWIAIAAGVGSSKWASLSGGTLAQTLAKGNTSGANDLAMSDGRFVALGESSPAETGIVRLQSASEIKWRDASDARDIGVGLDGSDVLQIGTSTGAYSDIQLNVDSLVAVHVNGSAFGTIGTFFGNFAILADGDNAAGIVIFPGPPTGAAPGLPVAIGGGDGGSGNQDGGDCWLQAGAKSGAGSDGSVGIKDSSAAWRLQIDPDDNFIYNAEASHTWQFGSLDWATLTTSGSELTLKGIGDQVTKLVMTVSAPTAAANGADVAIIGANATIDGDGGSAYLKPGALADSGVHGSAGIQDTSGAWAFRFDGTGAFYEISDSAAGDPATPGSGGRLAVVSGAARYRGSGGTLTTLGPA